MLLCFALLCFPGGSRGYRYPFPEETPTLPRRFTEVLVIYPILKDYFPLFRETLGARATSVTLDGAWTIWEDTYGQIDPTGPLDDKCVQKQSHHPFPLLARPTRPAQISFQFCCLACCLPSPATSQPAIQPGGSASSVCEQLFLEGHCFYYLFNYCST